MVQLINCVTAFVAFVVLAALTNGKIVRMDFQEDMESLGVFFDHLELNQYYETMEEVLGVNHTYQQNNERRGIWVYKPEGPGSCCGGSLEFRVFNTENGLWGAGDKLEVEITYYGNKGLWIYPVSEGGNLTGNPVILDLPPSQGRLLDWTVARATMNSSYEYVVFRTELGLYTGYFILDGINFFINEG